MIWEAAFWSVAALALTTASRARPWLEPRLGRRVELLEAALPWAHGLGLPYLAVVTGAVSGRDAGLYGHDVNGWLAGGAACAAVLGPAALMRWRWPSLLHVSPSYEQVLDEPRWTLYRAAGSLWVGVPWVGAAIGLIGALVERGLALWMDRSMHGAESGSWVELPGLAWFLVRALVSTAIFALTRNFWLTVAVHAGLVGIARRGRSGGEA